MADLSFDDLIPSAPDYGRAISSIESGGNYKAIGPPTKTGDRALGKYQVMGNNIGPWSEEVLGRRVTPQEFIQSPEIQDKIFQGKFGQYTEKYGPEGAAKAWFAGEAGMNNPNAKDVLGTTVSSYAAKFNKAVGPTEISARAKTPVDVSFDDLIPTEKPQEGPSFDDRFPAEGEFAPRQPSITDAITDIPKEVKGAANEALTNIKGIANRGGQGPVEGLVTTGKAALGIPQLLMSPITGAARSVGGHVLESATNAAGELIAPDLAAKRDRQKDYETAKGDVDTAMSAVGGRNVPVKAPKAAAPSVQELKSASRAGYKSPEVDAVEINPQSTASLSAKIENDLVKQGYRNRSSSPEKAVFEEVQALIPGQGVASVKVADLHSAQKALGIMARERDTMGQPTAKAAAASVAKQHLDDYLPNLSQADVLAGDATKAAEIMSDAGKNWGAAKRAEQVDTQLSRAERQAARSGMGGNAENAMRQKVSVILDNPKRAAGYSAEELQAMEQFVQGTRTRNSLRSVGKLGVDGGLSLLLNTAAAGLSGGTTIPVTVAGTLARILGERATSRAGVKLSEMVRERSPLASSTQKYIQAQAQLKANRTPQAVAGAILASRNLANNLQSAGFNVSPAKLLSGMQTSGAEEQEQIPRPDAE